jgi:hypothetical protein
MLVLDATLDAALVVPDLLDRVNKLLAPLTNA